MLQQLKAPLPYSHFSSRSAIDIARVGGFVSVFLLFFYGDTFTQQGESAIVLSMLFGMVTTTVAVVYAFLIDKVIMNTAQDLSWNLLKWVVYSSGLLLVLSLANYSLLIVILDSSFELIDAVNIVKHTVAIGLFPVIFSGYVVQLKTFSEPKRIDKDQKLTNEVTEKEILTLVSKNKKQKLQLEISSVFYIESLGNYVIVCYSEEERIVKEILRNTIKNVETQLEHTTVIRCHRSYMVNVRLLKGKKGNAQGLKLCLRGLNSFEIPVSRKYVSVIKALS